MAYGIKLTDQEITKRLSRLRNLERLHIHDRQQIKTLQAENKQLRLELLNQRTAFQKVIQTQNARISELETMVFGRKPGGSVHQTKLRLVSARVAASYRRPIPPADAITSTTDYPVSSCHECGGPLTDLRQHIRYLEDVDLSAMSSTSHKTVEQQTIARGYCGSCGHYSSGRDLGGQVVSLGPQVRALVVYLTTIQGLTFTQVTTQLWDMYRFPVSSGEVAVVLDDQRLHLLPEYTRLLGDIRAGPAHLDESRYRIQSQQNAGYAFTMTSAKPKDARGSTDVVFKLADSRGKGHAKALIGEHYTEVGITDRYGAYKHMFVPGCHQICWAHLQRIAKDLAGLECLGEETQSYVTRFYHRLAGIYHTIRDEQTRPFIQTVREQAAAQLLQQVTDLCQPNSLDPKKLARLKHGILEYQDCLFLCLTKPGIPADNNKAERAIRKLVLKRVRSFGVKTPNGARTLEVLMSVAWSLWYKDRSHYFSNYLQLTQQVA